MTDPDSLAEWNRLNKANAENALTSAMFSSLISTSPVIDRFCSWLLAGTAATAALLVANADKLVPFLGEAGFRIAGVFLVVSGVFGLISKACAVQCQISIENEQRVRDFMSPILDKHAQDEEKILEFAQARGVSLLTELDLGRVLAEFAKPFPRWVGWLLGRHLAKHAGNPQIGYLLPIRFYLSQSLFMFLQVVFFLVFICAALFFA
jgi:hypothetical protein